MTTMPIDTALSESASPLAEHLRCAFRSDKVPGWARGCPATPTPVEICDPVPHCTDTIEVEYETIDTCECIVKRERCFSDGSIVVTITNETTNTPLTEEEFTAMAGNLRRKSASDQIPFAAEPVCTLTEAIDTTGAAVTVTDMADTIIAEQAPVIAINGVDVPATAAQLCRLRIESRNICDKNGNPLLTEAGAPVTQDCWLQDDEYEDANLYEGDTATGTLNPLSTFEMPTDGTYLASATWCWNGTKAEAAAIVAAGAFPA